MQSYRLTVKFYSPIVYYQPPTLDGIVSYCLAKEEAVQDGLMSHYASRQAFPYHNRGVDKLHKLIEHKGGAYGVPVASFLQPLQQSSEFLDSWKKRFDSQHSHYLDFGRGARRVNTASGFYRSCDMPLNARMVSTCVFYFIGDGQEVVRMMQQNIVGIGKKISEGFGWIDQIELTEVDMGWRDILRMRPVPIFIALNHGIDGNHQICGWKPPYWVKSNICECVVP